MTPNHLTPGAHGTRAPHKKPPTPPPSSSSSFLPHASQSPPNQHAPASDLAADSARAESLQAAGRVFDRRTTTVFRRAKIGSAVWKASGAPHTCHGRARASTDRTSLNPCLGLSHTLYPFDLGLSVRA